MKNKNIIHYLLLSLIGFLVLIVGYIYYIGIFTNIDLADNTKGAKTANKQHSENHYLTSNFMDDFFMSLLIEEGIVTQRGIGAHNHIDSESINRYRSNNDGYNKITNHSLNVKSSVNIDFDNVPQRIPRNTRYQISLTKAKEYPSLKPYLEANNLPDTLRVMKIFDNNSRKTFYILSLDPLS